MSRPDSIRWLKRPVLLNYGAAVLSVIVALFIAPLIQVQYEFEPFVLFILAMMFSAWYGGVKPGLLSIALSLIAFHYYFLIPIYPLGLEKEIPRLLFAGLTSVLIVLLGAAQRSATETLRESELRLRQIAENIREVFWMANRALDEPLYVSPAYESIWGRSLESLRQQPRSFFEAIHVEDREHAVAIIMEQREQEIDIEYRIVRPDGTLRWIRDRRFPVKDASGKVYRVAGIAEDITERKNAEEALWRSEQKLHEWDELYRILTENANDLIRVHELDGRSIYASPSVVRLYGQEPARVFQFAHPDDLAICRQWWDRVPAKGREPLRWRVRDRDGGWRWIETQGSLVQYHGQPHVMTVCRDVTEWKKAEEALREAASQLEALSRRLVELQESERKELARELHDRIGQSLTALNINLKILATSLPPQVSDELRARFDDSETLVESTAAAIRNVMSELRPPMLDDQGIAPALDWYVKQFSARTGIAVAVRGLEPAERPAPEMEIALFRVAQEALNNVAKHARARRVEITLGRSGSEYVMTVEDDGVGFDAAEDSVARQAGLGMVTMRERTQALGGRLEVRAGRGDGTRLTVRVPA